MQKKQHATPEESHAIPLGGEDPIQAVLVRVVLTGEQWFGWIVGQSIPSKGDGMTQEQRELLHVTVAAERNVPDKLLVRGRWRPEHWDTGEAEVAGLPHTGVPSLWTGLQDAGYVPRLVEWDKMEDSAAGRSRYRFTVVFSNDEGHPVAQFMENKKAVEEVRRVIETCAGFCWAWDNRRSQVPTVTVNLAGCQMTVMPKHKIVVKSEELKAVRA